MGYSHPGTERELILYGDKLCASERACGFGTGHWVAIATGVTDTKEIGIDEWDNGMSGFVYSFVYWCWDREGGNE